MTEIRIQIPRNPRAREQALYDRMQLLLVERATAFDRLMDAALLQYIQLMRTVPCPSTFIPSPADPGPYNCVMHAAHVGKCEADSPGIPAMGIAPRTLRWNRHPATFMV